MCGEGAAHLGRGGVLVLPIEGLLGLDDLRLHLFEISGQRPYRRYRVRDLVGDVSSAILPTMSG